MAVVNVLCPAVGPGRRDSGDGGEDDVRPATEVHGAPHV